MGLDEQIGETHTSLCSLIEGSGCTSEEQVQQYHIGLDPYQE
jgi:hypothetical protein